MITLYYAKQNNIIELVVIITHACTIVTKPTKREKQGISGKNSGNGKFPSKTSVMLMFQASLIDNGTD